jgi:hypothetical protein
MVAKSRPPATIGRAWRFLGQDKEHARSNLELVPGEYLLVSVDLHWFHVARNVVKLSLAMPVAFTVSIALDFLSNSLWWLQIILWIATMGHECVIGHRILAWRADLLMATNRRLIREYGVFTRTTCDVNLHEITSIEVYESLPGRMFGYGQIIVESAGKHNNWSERESVRFVRNPKRIRLAAQTYGLDLRRRT